MSSRFVGSDTKGSFSQITPRECGQSLHCVKEAASDVHSKSMYCEPPVLSASRSLWVWGS